MSESDKDMAWLNFTSNFLDQNYPKSKYQMRMS